MDDHECEKNYQLARSEIKKAIEKPLTHELIIKIHNIAVGPKEPHGYRGGGGAPTIEGLVTGNGLTKKKVAYWAPDSAIYSIDGMMKKLLDWFEVNRLELPIDELIAKLHWELVKIHPFKGGNGRTARLLVVYVLFMRGYNDVECKNLELYFEKNRVEYDKALDDGQFNYRSCDQANEQWLTYIRQALLSIRTVK